eukprot:3315904-Prymnesium_polylepis.1
MRISQGGRGIIAAEGTEETKVQTGYNRAHGPHPSVRGARFKCRGAGRSVRMPARDRALIGRSVQTADMAA